MHEPNPTASPVVADAREIAPHCWLISGRHPRALLQCNTYLRTYESGSGNVHVCVDPGSRLDWPHIQANLTQLVGGPGEVHAFTLNHQDPDVVGNAPDLCLANPRIRSHVTEDVWRLVQHLDFQPGHVEFVNETRSGGLQQGRLQAVATPFCHFRGAMAFYDPEIATLFTGDLFGGLNQLGRVHLFAENEDWVGVAQFHQIYMPVREALRHAVRQIRALQPAVKILAPQHGHVITGDLVPMYLERMHELLVGCDLLALEFDNTCLEGYRRVIDGIVAWADDVMGASEVRDRLRRWDRSDGLERLLNTAGDEVRLLANGYSAVAKLVARLMVGEADEFVNSLRSVALALCFEYEVPIPPLGAGLEAGENAGV